MFIAFRDHPMSRLDNDCACPQNLFLIMLQHMSIFFGLIMNGMTVVEYLLLQWNKKKMVLRKLKTKLTAIYSVVQFYLTMYFVENLLFDRKLF